jgi:antitoxin ParD1/3/4
MMIQLSEEREQIVRSLMQDGGFASEDEVIDTALRLLQEHGEQAKLADLRREIAIGIEEADRGELAPFDPHGTLGRIRARQASNVSST